MDHDHNENPMAEIALALAMGFFAIMVLAVVSMAAGPPSEASEGRVVAAALRPSAESAQAPATIETPEPEALIIFDGHRYLDAQLRPVEPSALSSRHDVSPLVLAIAPTLTLAEAMDARARIDRDDVVVATLEPAWLQALEGSSP